MRADFSPSTIFLGDEDRSEEAERSRRVSRSLLLPQGRPGVWLVLLGALCAWVIVEALRLRFL